MILKNQVYKCNVCGNIVEVLHAGGGELVCCGQKMELLNEKTKENEGKEKHAPIVEKTESGVKVKVGSLPHPMEEKHYIEWIELVAGGASYKKFLKPGHEPQAEFCFKANEITVRAYCNIHGLWKTK